MVLSIQGNVPVCYFLLILFYDYYYSIVLVYNNNPPPPHPSSEKNANKHTNETLKAYRQEILKKEVSN
jgi:hypothetical protein